MFSILILSLGITQIVEGDRFEEQLANESNDIVTQSVPRGVIFDRNNNVIVGNSAERAITYTRSSNTTLAEVMEIAEKLATLIEVDDSGLRERDKKDFWMLRNPDEARELVPIEEEREIRAAGEEEGKSSDEINAEIYQLQLERITSEMLDEFTSQDLQVLTIYNKMIGGTRGTPQIIKSGSSSRSGENYVTDEEFAIVTEHLSELSGVATKTDWQRSYPFGSTLRTVLGNVSTSSEGLPSDQIDHFLVRGYNRNDRVGTSYIEQVFEDFLHGTPRKLQVNTDDNGNIIDTSVLYAGERGSDLVLTIDMELQQQVEEIVEEQLLALAPSNPEADRAFVVMMDPNTGDILSLVGKQLIRNEETGEKEIRDFALGTFTTSYDVGSAIKGATLLMAWDSGAMVPGQYILDERLHFAGSPSMGSIVNMGLINDLTAMERSSNVYMFKSVMAMGGASYVRNGPLRLDPSIFGEMRYYFNQFGLGVPTGINLPNEVSGQVGQGTMMGSALFLGIGQYDTYTPLQLAQFISTIANGGYRLQPQILRAVREPNAEEEGSGRIIQEATPVILNRINAKDEWIERIQEGHRLVMQGSRGTGRVMFGDAPYRPAGKTGTAEVRINRRDVQNQTLVAYAPYDNPEVAISVVVPFVEGNSRSSQIIGRAVLDAYFDLQQGSAEEGESDGDAEN